MSLSAAVYLLVLLSGAFATLRFSPMFGVMLYELQYLVNPPGRWWYQDLPQLRYSYFIMVLVLVSYLPRASAYSENRFFSFPQYRWLAALTLVIVVTYLWALDPQLHLDTTLRLLKVLLFVVVAFKVTDAPWKLESAVGAFVAGTSYLSFVIWQTGRTGAGRLEGIGAADTSDANGTAALLATPISLLIFYVLFGKRRWQQFACLVALAFTLNALILLNSRGALLALTLGSAYFSLRVFREKGLKGQKLKVVLGVCAVACLFVFLADDVFWERMATLNDGTDMESYSRVDYWKKTPEMLQDYPLGGGAQAYKILSPIYLPKEWLTGGRRAVHSTWFEVLSEYGYHGLFLFLGYVGSVFVLSQRVRARLRKEGDTYHLFFGVALESALLVMLVAGSFVNDFYGEIGYWLAMFIAVFANIHLNKRPEAAAAGAWDS